MFIFESVDEFLRNKHYKCTVFGECDCKWLYFIAKRCVLLVYFTLLEQEDEEASTGSHLKLIVDAFLQQLPNCVNRDLIDKVQSFSS